MSEMEIDLFWALVNEVGAIKESGETVPEYLKDIEQWTTEWQELMNRRQQLVAKHVEEIKKNDGLH